MKILLKVRDRDNTALFQTCRNHAAKIVAGVILALSIGGSGCDTNISGFADILDKVFQPCEEPTPEFGTSAETELALEPNSNV